MQIQAPSRNAAHRLACLSLYRDILRQCIQLTSNTATHSNSGGHRSSHTLREIVRYRFKTDKKYDNWQQIRNALQFGRGVLQFLEEANTGSPKAINKVANIVATARDVALHQKKTLESIKQERSQRQVPKDIVKRKERVAFLEDKSNYRSKPDTAPVLERPVPYERALKDQTGYRRKVPDYFVVQGIPFLRYSRHQPLSLSRNLRQQIRLGEKFWENRAVLEEMMALADAEDEWDHQLWEDHRLHQSDLINQRGDRSYSWREVHHAAYRDNGSKAVALDARRMEYGEQLWDVYLKEKELAEAENAARKDANRRRWQQQQQQVNADQAGTQRVAARSLGGGRGSVRQDDTDRSTVEYRPPCF